MSIYSRLYADSDGSVLLAEDTSGKGHSSRVASNTDSMTVMVQL